MIVFDHIRKGLKLCQIHQAEHCQPMFEKLMLATCVAVVDFQTVVPCPNLYDYPALSYVWSGIHRAPGILEVETLLQMIEDVLALLKK